MSAQSTVERLRDQWRATPPVAQFLAALETYGAGAAWEECQPLAARLASAEAARGLIAALITALCGGLRAHPQAHVPLRHQFARGISVLELARSGRASLSLVACEAAAADHRQPACSVTFSDEERHELCLSGAGYCRVMRLIAESGRHARLEVESRRLSPSDRLELGRNAARLIDRIEGRLVLLRLVRTDVKPGPVREYAVADGRLLHQASGDRRESRDEMAIALLGRMGRVDAAAPMAALACGQDGAHLRWQALRNALALDSRIGFAALEQLAGNARDPLATPAADLRRRLIAAHPELTAARPCPA